MKQSQFLLSDEKEHTTAVFNDHSQLYIIIPTSTGCNFFARNSSLPLRQLAIKPVTFPAIDNNRLGPSKI